MFDGFAPQVFVLDQWQQIIMAMHNKEQGLIGWRQHTQDLIWRELFQWHIAIIEAECEHIWRVFIADQIDMVAGW
jgi:hypothetical protein